MIIIGENFMIFFVCMSFNMDAEKLQSVERINVGTFLGGYCSFGTNPQAEIIRTSVDFFFTLHTFAPFFLMLTESLNCRGAFILM